MKFKLKKMMALSLGLTLSAAGYSHAAETAALSEHYLERVPARFGHGFMNTVFGWTALGVAPYQARQEGAGGGDAFAQAITQPFAMTFLGIWDLATFWVPGEFGRSMAVPRHVWMARETKAAVPAPAAADESLEGPIDMPEADAAAPSVS